MMQMITMITMMMLMVTMMMVAIMMVVTEQRSLRVVKRVRLLGVNM